MRAQGLVVALTFLNMVITAFSWMGGRGVEAQGVAGVLRGRAFEVVDERGRVRASISVLPADPQVKMPDGTTGYPETVLLRLINSQGRPNVKIGATEKGSVIGLGGISDPTYIQLEAVEANTSLTLTNGNGRRQLLRP